MKELNDAFLTADCDRCAALCCFALAFDKSEWFPEEKPNGFVCTKLGPNNNCTIYENRESEGYRGCIKYDCLGAGQRVTQEVFSGRSWRDDPQLLWEMTEAFTIMRRIHEQLQLLNAAKELPLTSPEIDQFDAFLSEISPEDGWTADLLEAYQVSGFAKRLSAFLMSLRHHVA